MSLPINRIFIIGHPGAGKGLLAKTLATKLGWEFIDADFGLEMQMGKMLSAILGKEGEKSFHQAEYQILTMLLKKPDIVVATDAAVVTSKDNLNLLSNEYVVYLQVDVKTQLERLTRHPEPLIQHDLNRFLQQLHDERDDDYQRLAKLTIDGNDGELEQHVLQIMTAAKINHQDMVSDQIHLDKRDFVLFHKLSHMPVYLSPHQAKCLKLLAQGKSSKEIANDLAISHRTVEGYIAKMMEMLGCASSKELMTLYHDKP